MGAVENIITDNLPIWSSAIQSKSSAGRGTSGKRNLYGVKKLRELILDLAVRGLLVPQDPDDEPASVLLEKVAAEKERLIKEGKIKKQKIPTIKNESSYEQRLPDGWVLTNLISVYDVRDGTHDSPKYQPSGFPLVTSKNLSSGELDIKNVKFISQEDHLKICDRSQVEKDDILFAMIGSIGNAVIVNIDPEFSIKNVALFKYYKKSISAPSYLLRFLLYAEHQLKAEASGAVQSFVSLSKLREFAFPLPPLAEQHRIVAKVDELMALCDQLKSSLQQAQETQIQLTDAVVENALITQESPE
jgi:type I restriction enzyme, S subunit